MVFGHQKFIGFVVLHDLTVKAFESLEEPQLVNSAFQVFRFVIPKKFHPKFQNYDLDH